MIRISPFLRSLAHGAWSAIAPVGPAARDRRWDHVLLPLVRPGFPVAVCWSAKGGCTTVLKWFLAHNGLLDEAIAHSPWVHDYREQRLCAGAAYRSMCERLFGGSPADTFVVKVIREPAGRAVSGYLHFLRWQDEAGWQAVAAVDRWKRENGLGPQRGLSFRQFLRFLADEMRQGRVIDPHFRPQYEPLHDPRVQAHIPLEHLAAGLAELERLFRLPTVDVGGLSASIHHNPPTGRCAWPETPAAFPADRDTLETLGTPPSVTLLDDESRELVHEVYRTDFDAYGSVYPRGIAPSSPPPLCPASPRRAA